MTPKKLLLLMLLAAGLAGCARSDLIVNRQQRRGGTDVTFFILADTHIGTKGIVPFTKAMIQAMNELPGTWYPGELGGWRVARPRGVLIAGDLTEAGSLSHWKTFVGLFGRTGKEGLLKYPVYLGTGNHDRLTLGSRAVMSAVEKRHGKLDYSWDWDDVHLVCLDVYPNAAASRWLKKDLAAVGRDRPVVIFFHYVFAETTPGKSWWDDPPKKAFLKAIDGYNVIGVFHGHDHATGHRRWRGFDVYNVSAPRSWGPTFQVVRITDTTMSVATWNWKKKQWGWRHSKAINATGRIGKKASQETADRTPNRGFHRSRKH